MEPLKIPVEKPFDFFLSEISKKTYTPQNKTVGVNVYKYKLAAAANIKIQFVIDASQKNLELPHKRLDFLSTEKRIALGLEKEDKLYNVSKLFIKLYGKSECYFSYAEDSFGGFAIAHNFLNTLEPASKEEKQKGPLYELDKNDFILNEKNFILEKSSDFSSIKNLSENQKNQFETWFTKNQNSKKEPPKSSSEKIKNLIWEYLTVKRHSELPSITQSDLKNFFPCPRNWIFKNVLKLKEDSLDAQLMTPFTMGNINHKVLELFLKWCIKENNKKIPCVDITTEKFSDSDYQRISNAICDFVEQTILEDSKMDFHTSPLTKLVLISQKQAIADNIINFLLTFCKPLENKGFGNCSVAFSEEWISTAETDNQEIQKSIKTEKTQWAYSGKIDCVIIDDEENVYIVDFKTGKTPTINSCIANDKKELGDFQIPQYITLLNSAKPNFEISKALFYSINKKMPVVIVDSSDKKWGTKAQKIEDYQSTIEIFYDYTKHCISKIEKNNLEPKKDSNDIFNNVDPYTTCVNCGFKQICRTTYSIK